MLSKQHLLTLTSTWTREACEVCVFLLGKGGCNTNPSLIAKNEGRLLSTTKNAIELVVLLVATGNCFGVLFMLLVHLEIRNQSNDGLIQH